MKRIPILILAATMGAGCVSMPAPQGNVYSAAYVGDRDTVTLDEIAVSVPATDNATGIRNLHIFLSAIINPTRTSTAEEYGADSIVRRAHPRIASELVADLVAGKIDATKGLADLRMQLLSKAKSVFDPIYAKWTHSEDLQVELVLTSLFYTNGSAGKSSGSSRFW